MDLQECTTCQGTGNLSSCCGAAKEGKLCSCCGAKYKAETCKVCKGKGEVGSTASTSVLKERLLSSRAAAVLFGKTGG